MEKITELEYRLKITDNTLRKILKILKKENNLGYCSDIVLEKIKALVE